MNNCLALLGRAKALLEEEAQEMALGNIDAAEEKFLLRSQLMDEAWESRASAPATEYARILREICDLQEKLSADTAAFKEKLREKLAESRMQTKRLAGYRQAVVQAVRYQ